MQEEPGDAPPTTSSVDTWFADVAIRSALVVAAIAAAAAVRAGWLVPEIAAVGGVAAMMAWIGPQAWRPWW